MNVTKFLAIVMMARAIVTESGGLAFLVGSRSPFAIVKCAYEWVNAGFTPDSARPWWRHGGCNARTCRLLAGEGVRPSAKSQNATFVACNYLAGND